MSIRTLLCTTALLCLAHPVALQAQPPPGDAAKPPEIAPHKRSLAIPIALGPPKAQPAPTVECLVTLGPTVPICALAFSPDGKTLAQGGYQEVLLWDLANGKLAKRIGAGQVTGFVRRLAFHKDGRLLAVAEGTPHGPGAVRGYDVESGQQTLNFPEPKDVVYALAFSPDGKLLAAGGADALVHVWSIEEKKLVTTIKEHGDWVLGLAFSADGKFLATASADRSARVFEVEGWKPAIRMPETDTVNGAAFSPDGQLLASAVGGPAERAIRIRRKDNAQQARLIDTGRALPLDIIWAPPVTKPAPKGAPPPPQGGGIYVAGSDKTVKVFSGANGNLVATLSGHGDWVYAVALSADGTKLASGSGDGTVKLWSAVDNKPLATLVQLSPRTDEWLAITAQGYHATSSAGALQWKTANLTIPPEKITSLLQNAEMVQKAIAGEQSAPPVLQ